MGGRVLLLGILRRLGSLTTVGRRNQDRIDQDVIGGGSALRAIHFQATRLRHRFASSQMPHAPESHRHHQASYAPVPYASASFDCGEPPRRERRYRWKAAHSQDRHPTGASSCFSHSSRVGSCQNGYVLFSGSPFQVNGTRSPARAAFNCSWKLSHSGLASR